MIEQNRVILVNGDNSKFFDQAIFIVKKNIPENKIPVDCVAEAEKIVGQHLARKGHDNDCYVHFSPELEIDLVKDELARRKRSLKVAIAFNIIFLMGCLTLAYFMFIH